MLFLSIHIKAAGSGARHRGGEKSHGTGTRTADTNYLSNWSKCSQKCHLLKDQLISSCCSPNNSRGKKNSDSHQAQFFCELWILGLISLVLSAIDEALCNIYFRNLLDPLENLVLSGEQTCDSFFLPNQDENHSRQPETAGCQSWACALLVLHMLIWYRLSWKMQ